MVVINMLVTPSNLNPSMWYSSSHQRQLLARKCKNLACCNWIAIPFWWFVGRNIVSDRQWVAQTFLISLLWRRERELRSMMTRVPFRAQCRPNSTNLDETAKSCWRDSRNCRNGCSAIAIKLNFWCYNQTLIRGKTSVWERWNWLLFSSATHANARLQNSGTFGLGGVCFANCKEFFGDHTTEENR